MFPIQPLIAGILVPLLVSLTVWWVGGRVLPTSKHLAGVAVGAAFMSAQIGLSGFPEFPATEASAWLFWLVPAVLLLTPLLERLPHPLRRATYLLGLAGILCLLLQPMIAWHWQSPLAYIGWPAAFTLAGLACGGAFARIEKTGEPRRALALPALFGLSAVLLAASGSLVLGQLSGAAAIALSPFALSRRPFLGSGMIALAALLLIALLAMGICYANLHPLLALAIILPGQLAAHLPARGAQQAVPVT